MAEPGDAVARAPKPTRLGLDLVEVAEVTDAIAKHGPRYLARVFTQRELDQCAGRDAELAGLLAAKEAVMKLLDVGDQELPWTSIEVCGPAGRRPQLVLAGRAMEIAARCGLAHVELSVSPGRVRAMALALGY